MGVIKTSAFFYILKIARILHFQFIVKHLRIHHNLGMFRRYNPNPCNARVGDCTVRALCKLFDADWYEVYDDLCAEGRYQCDMPSSNAVWGAFLILQGYKKHVIDNNSDHIQTVREFADNHPEGTYLLATGSHVVCVIDGDYFDSWNSGDEVPVYYWQRKEE